MNIASSLALFSRLKWAIKFACLFGVLFCSLCFKAHAMGPTLHVHSECQFCADSYDTTTVTINFQLGGPHADGHYQVYSCDNNGYNCQIYDFNVTNNVITSGATQARLHTVFGDGRGQVTFSFILTVDHDYFVWRPADGQYGWIDAGQSAAYNTPGDVASDYPQSVTVTIDPTPTPTPVQTPSVTTTSREVIRRIVRLVTATAWRGIAFTPCS